MTTHVFLQKFNLGVLVSTCFTLKMPFTTVWRLWILFIWSWILILILILFLHVLQDAFVWFFSTVCFQMLSPIVCLHTYNHTCCIVTRWNGFSPECFFCDLSNHCRKSYIFHTNYRRNVLKSTQGWMYWGEQIFISTYLSFCGEIRSDKKYVQHPILIWGWWLYCWKSTKKGAEHWNICIQFLGKGKVIRY